MDSNRNQASRLGFAALLCTALCTVPWLASATPACAQNAGAPSAPAADSSQTPPPPRQLGGYQQTGPAQGKGGDKVVELPPTPMLDEDGKQRLDPDGKPMFNPPVRQQRDKKGRPVVDDKGRPVMQTADEMGFDEKGKKIRGQKERGPKTTSMAVVRGILTVDGLPAKAALNYDIPDLKYVYFYAPFVGTAIVSAEPFPGAIEQKDAFNDHTLTVTVGDHVFQLYSDERLLGKRPEPAFVLVDRDFRLATRNPAVGYGSTNRAPYAWPGAKEQTVAKGTNGAPPLPANLRPVALLPPCPQGEMRSSQPAGRAGKSEGDESCVANPAVTPATSGSTAPRPQ